MGKSVDLLQGNTLVIVGRMRPGVTVAEAQAELERARGARRRRQERP